MNSLVASPLGLPLAKHRWTNDDVRTSEPQNRDLMYNCQNRHVLWITREPISLAWNHTLFHTHFYSMISLHAVRHLSSKGSLPDAFRSIVEYFRTAVLWLQQTSGWHPDKNIRLVRMDGLDLLKLNKNEEIERLVLMYILSAQASDKEIWRILMCFP